MTPKACPMGHGPMELKHRNKTSVFRDVELTVDVTEHVCPVCGMTASDVETAGKVQRQIADTYRLKIQGPYRYFSAVHQVAQVLFAVT